MDLGVGDQERVERPLESPDLLGEQRNLRPMAGGLELGELVELAHVRHVELLEQAVDAVLGADDLVNQAEPCAHEDEYYVIEASNPKLAGWDGAVKSYVEFLYSLA